MDTARQQPQQPDQPPHGPTKEQQEKLGRPAATRYPQPENRTSDDSTPHPPADRWIEAKEAEAKLLQDARDRVTRLEVLAREVQATDRELRLRSLTDTGAEHATSLEVVDSTRAMLSAYREVKGLSHLESTSKGKDSKAGEVQKPPDNGNQGLFDMLKQWWSD